MNRFLIAALLLMAFGRCQIERKSAEPPPAVQKSGTIVSYSARTLDGQPFTLPDKKGRVLLLNAWATWCAPCREEIPELKILQQQYSGQNFDIIGISVDTEDAVGAVREFVDEQKINYPIVLDPAGKIMTTFQSYVLPTSVLLDRSGKVVWTRIGAVQAGDDELREALRKALGPPSSG